MNPDQQAQFDDMEKRLGAVEDYVSAKKTQQISYPVDEVSKRILEELILGTSPTPDDTKLLLTGDYVWSTRTADTGRRACDGGAISRTDFSALFAVIGTTYGSGDGTTTFNVPNLVGRVMVMIGNATFTAMGQTGGEETHVLTTAEMPSHTHSMGSFFSGAGVNNGVSGGAPVNTVNTQTGTAGTDGAHNNLQPYLVARCYIIE